MASCKDGVCELPKKSAATTSSTTASTDASSYSSFKGTLSPLNAIAHLLESPEGKPLSSSQLNDLVNKRKVIGLYFSAVWCPPCRQFSPLLAEFQKLHKDELDIIYVGLDRSSEEQASNTEGKPWISIPFANETDSIKQGLAQSCAVSMIPTLVIVNAETGKKITDWGRSAVMKNYDHCLDEWKQGRHGISWYQLLKPW